MLYTIPKNPLHIIAYRTLVPSRGHASSDERFPGRMSATLFHKGLSSPFWVLDVFSDTQNGGVCTF